MDTSLPHPSRCSTYFTNTFFKERHSGMCLIKASCLQTHMTKMSSRWQYCDSDGYVMTKMIKFT